MPRSSSAEQRSFLNQMELPKEDPVDLWQIGMRVHHLEEGGIAPKYFHEQIMGGRTMPELIRQAERLIYRESLAQWEIIYYDYNKPVLTAFEEGRARVSSTAIAEEAGLAAFVLWAFSPGRGLEIPSCAALYGIRRQENMLRGALLHNGVPSPRAKDQKVERIYEISGKGFGGALLHVSHWGGHKLEKLGFDLGGI